MEQKQLLKEIKESIAKIKKRKFKNKKIPKIYRLEQYTINELSNISKDEDLTYNQLFKFLIKIYKQ